MASVLVRCLAEIERVETYSSTKARPLADGIDFVFLSDGDHDVKDVYCAAFFGFLTFDFTVTGSPERTITDVLSDTPHSLSI